MWKNVRGSALTSALALATVLGAGSEAMAAGFQLREQSSEGLGNAFAGSAAKAYNLSTIFYNPAGMTRLEGNQTAGSATVIMPVAKFEGSNTLTTGTQTTGSMGGDAINDAAVGAFYAMWDARPDFKVGVAVTAPFGLRSDYEEDWVGRFHALESSITNINFSPNVAYRINDHLSIGGGAQVAYTKVRLSNAVNLGAAGQAKAVVEGDDVSFGGVAGMLYEFTPTSRVGVNYRSRMKNKLKGDATYQASAATKAAVGNPQSLQDVDATADLTLPDTMTLSLYHELSPEWAVMGDVQWTNWSTFKEVRIKFADGRADAVTEEKWDDTWFFSLGATYTMNEQHKFHFGVAYDQAPMSDQYRTARIPDANRYWLSLGYTYDVDPNFSTNIGYTHIFADSANINEQNKSNSGVLTGSYDAYVDIISASFVVKF
ncbi:OmpP1/FadL family transporter [Magnetospirillum aberrantis]|uniref:Transporter n=1 Tax=Magnetospirillum aberrantis SpK TaxID=908842 RepID=A0A7C9QUL1_9PROT|nr:outer membrane protein transport protein [Magnetospirillum aberrantis]NFV79656.1 transporter [Magnetospirillum aberrantis SpK]